MEMSIFQLLQGLLACLLASRRLSQDLPTLRNSVYLLSMYLSVCLSVCEDVCLSVCLSFYVYVLALWSVMFRSAASVS